MSGEISEGSWINPRHLVKVLVQEPFFQASLLVLLEDKQLQPPKVRKLVATYPQLFRLNDEVVELHPKVAICRPYRCSTGCVRGMACRRLHICVKYIAGDCDGSDCPLIHDWDAEPNVRILYEKFLEELSPSTLCKLMHTAYKELNEVGITQEECAENVKVDNPTGKDTLSTSSQKGAVKIPEICHSSVNGKCGLEERGCPRLHAPRHYHWQVRKKEESWYNLPETQVKELEQSYCNPSSEHVSLTLLEPIPNGPIQIMGRDLWEADFESSTLGNSKGETLELRRLCTELIQGEKILENTHLWYISLNDRWRCFGSSSGDQIISALSSETIEHGYASKEISIARFKIGGNSCIINYNTMVYTNEKTSISHRLRRRPYPHIPEDEEFDVPPLPPTWQEMPPGEPFVRVPLNPFSAEYQEIMDIIIQARISNERVDKIERIQNPALWRKFQRRVLEMMATSVNIKYLFHSTKMSSVLSICENNFERKLQDSGFTDEYGQGNYFLSDALRALRFCEPDENNRRHLIVAKVAVGTITEGNASMNEPPTDPDIDVTYDSTVNNIENPTIYVKYNNDECYPGYVVRLAQVSFDFP